MMLVSGDSHLFSGSPGIWKPLLVMSVQGPLFYCVLLFLESDTVHHFCHCFHRLETAMRWPTKQTYTGADNEMTFEDDDVISEKDSVVDTPLDMAKNDNDVLIKSMTKKYGEFVAVDRLHLAVPKGECFGLIGTNGAGKTSVFKMLIGEDLMCDGEAFMVGYNVCYGTKKMSRYLGYCPQTDALVDQLTVNETLWLFARLRGSCPSVVTSRLVHQQIERFMLRDYIHVQASYLR